MASAASSPITPLLSDSQAKTLGLAAQAAVAVLLILGGAKIVTSILLITTIPLVAVLGVVEGGATLFLALILIKIATDLRYARAMPDLGHIHLKNALASWQDFCKTLIALGVIVLLSALVRYTI